MLDDRFIRRRLTKVGMIRAGLSPEAIGKNHPEKLSTLRFTSAAEHLIRDIASKYGGIPQQWQHPTQGRQWEVITLTASVPVMVPKQTIDAWFELWGARATLQRRCTGSRVVNLGCRCMCDPDGTMERDDPDRECSVVTRMSLLLADVPGLATWGIESHGWNAVDEWGRYANAIASLGEDDLWGAVLQLQKRSANAVGPDGKRMAKEFMVPVVLFDHVTSRQLAGGAAALSGALAGANRQNRAPAIEATGDRPAAIEATGDQPAAIEAAPAAPVLTDEIAAGFAQSIANTATVKGLDRARAALARYRPPEDHPLWQALIDRLLEIGEAANRAGGPAPDTVQEDRGQGDAAGGPVDAEVVEDPDAEVVEDPWVPAEPKQEKAARTATYTDVMTAAGRLKWTTSKAPLRRTRHRLSSARCWIRSRP
jgi:hypothetical protein